METKFSVNDWLPARPTGPGFTGTGGPKEEQQKISEAPKNENLPARPTGQPEAGGPRVNQEILNTIKILESNKIDLTADYKDWISIGFALASELGETGREYYHRISKMYPQYSITETDKQYDNCLKKSNGTISIRSFFFTANKAINALNPARPTGPGFTGTGGQGSDTPQTEVNTAKNEDSTDILIEEQRKFNTQVLPVKTYENLPKILKECTNLFVPGIEQDIILLSSITVLSACLPKIQGTYFNRSLSPHLYLFVTGPSASGKGTMVWSRNLAQSIHEEMTATSKKAREDYLKESEAYDALAKNLKMSLKKPEEPVRKMLFLPANSSTSAMTQILAENNFSGLIFESEADTLSNTAKQDWGDSSDIFRKAFHHENTSMARRLNKELIEITNPHLAICLSGTPKQVINLMPEVENGLFSRFMYYAFEDERGFLNPFVSYKEINYETFFLKRGYEVHALYNKLNKLKEPIDFKLTPEQANQFTIYFQQLLEKNKMLLSRDLDANTKRLGVITYRVAMVLSALRLMEMEIGLPLPRKITCSDVDFENAMQIAITLESHAIAVYQQMPKNNMKGLRLAFFEKLPVTFDRKTYVKIARELGIAERTADKYILYFKTKLLSYEYNEYKKIILE